MFEEVADLPGLEAAPVERRALPRGAGVVIRRDDL